jgi:hypothetical protein
MKLTIEIDENDVIEAIENIPAHWTSDGDSPIVRIALALKEAYEKARQ